MLLSLHARSLLKIHLQFASFTFYHLHYVWSLFIWNEMRTSASKSAADILPVCWYMTGIILGDYYFIPMTYFYALYNKTCLNKIKIIFSVLELLYFYIVLFFPHVLAAYNTQANIITQTYSGILMLRNVLCFLRKFQRSSEKLEFIWVVSLVLPFMKWFSLPWA